MLVRSAAPRTPPGAVAPPAPPGSKLAYLYLLRVPLISAIVFVVLPPAALLTPLRAFAVGIFDVDVRETWAVSTVAFMLSLAIMTTWWLVVAYADERCGVPIVEARFPVRKIWYVAAGLLAVPTLAVTCVVAGGDYVARTLWALAGLATATISFELWHLVMGWIDRLSWFDAIGAWLGSHQNLGAGYADPATGEILPGHRFALGLSIMTAVVYGVIVQGRGEVFDVPVPTLVYVILLIVIACWGMASAAFFFDRYRLPVLLPLAVLVAFTGFGQPWISDHYFQLRPAESAPPAPGEVLQARPAGAPASRSAVVIAANGGGIQAAAWTARALVGIEQLCRQRPGCRFAPAIRLISSVSGGTVGAMYVTAAFTDGVLPPNPVLDRITPSVETSSLENVGWGALYPDLWRVFFPHFSYDDRGSALEESWLAHFYGDRGQLERPLSAWNDDARLGRRPASIFNATITDSGERLLMSTAPPAPAPGRQTLGGTLYPYEDVSIVTAARLSSTFPWVTPAARPDTDSERELHFADGGYYDTYGVASLLDWLDEALEDNLRRPPDGRINRVLIVQLRGSPPDLETKGKRRGWFYQAYAPLATLLSVRDTGQLARNDEDVALFTKAWKSSVAVTSTTLQFCTPGDVTWRNAVPLSWHLTKDQKAAIESQWALEQSSANMKMTLDFLGTPDPPAGPPPAPAPPVPARCLLVPASAGADD